MFRIEYSREFRKSLKRCQKRGLDLELIRTVITILAKEGELPSEYKPHKLSGKYAGVWECHIKPDWLLLWKQDNENLILLFLNTGTHSDLF